MSINCCILTVTGVRSPTAYLSLCFVTPDQSYQVISRLRPTVMLVEHQVRGDQRTCVTLDEQAQKLLFG